jgi:hypothetical protein
LNDEWAKPAIDYPRATLNNVPKNKKKGKGTDVVSVVHRKGDAFSLEIIHILRDWFATALGRKHELDLPRARCQEVRRTILIAERVAADDDGLDPSWDGSRNTLEDDWLAEYGAAEDVADLGTRERATSGRAGQMRDGEGRRGQEGKPVYGSEVRTVPLGERHICFNLNSFTRSSSGVMVAHLMPTLYLRIASADSTVT